MVENREKKTLLRSVFPKIALLLVVPLGLSLGTLVSLIQDFGLVHTVGNIERDPCPSMRQDVP